MRRPMHASGASLRIQPCLPYLAPASARPHKDYSLNHGALRHQACQGTHRCIPQGLPTICFPLLALLPPVAAPTACKLCPGLSKNSILRLQEGWEPILPQPWYGFLPTVATSQLLIQRELLARSLALRIEAMSVCLVPGAFGGCPRLAG